MTFQHGKNRFRFIPLWVGVFSLILGFPLLALSSGYGMGDGHPMTGASSPHHGAGTKGHDGGHPGGGMHSGHGTKGTMGTGSHGPHQSASTFIDHILKFKDGMAITDDQVSKLQSIKTEFEKTKIRMKADIQLTSVDLHDLLRDDKGALNDVEAKLKSLYDKRADLYLASVKSTRDAKAVLTDEQRARMKTVHDRINAYKDTGMGAHGHPGGYSHHGKEQKS